MDESKNCILLRGLMPGCILARPAPGAYGESELNSRTVPSVNQSSFVPVDCARGHCSTIRPYARRYTTGALGSTYQAPMERLELLRSLRHRAD